MTLLIAMVRNHRCLRDGELVESGKHEELMALKGDYAELYNLQAAQFKN
jgi:ABC-type multidrug transport system fused ATPase/permease subunit